MCVSFGFVCYAESMQEIVEANKMTDSVRNMLRRTSLWPLLRSAKNAVRTRRLRNSTPFVANVEGISTLFHTDDPYSHGWFYPRYSGGKLHEEAATRPFVEMVRRSDVVADVGANLGWFTCIGATANRKARIFGFELDRANYDICVANVRLNGLQNVTMEHCAVSNTAGEVVYDAGGGASAIHRIGTEGCAQQSVSSITLDEYFAGQRPPDLVKIDVEGAEQLVLEGMRGLLGTSTLRTMFIEIHPPWLSDLGGSVREVTRLLQASGFRLLAISHRSVRHDAKPVDVEAIEKVASGGRMFVARKA